MNHNPTDRVTQLVDQHGRMVFATAYRILGNVDDAQEAFQEVFLKLLDSFNGRQKGHPVRDWGAYLRVVATRSAIDLLRENSRRTRWHKDLPDEIEDSRAPRSGQREDRQEMARTLRRAMTVLPDRDARVFGLKYFGDLSYEEIAAQTGLTVNQVGVILHRSRQRLRDVIAQVVKP